MKNFIRICITFCAVLLLLFVLLPVFCNHLLLPHLLKGLPFTEKDCSILQLTPWNLQGRLRLQEGAYGVAVPSISMSYSIPEVVAGKIERITVDSALLDIGLEEGGRIVFGRPVEKEQGATTKTETFSLPFAIGKITLRHCRIRLWCQGKPLLLEVDGDIELAGRKTGDAGWQITGVDLSGHVGGDIDADIALNTAEGERGLHHQLLLEMSDVSWMMPFAAIPDLFLSGAARLSAQVESGPDDRFSTVLSLSSEDFQARLGGIALGRSGEAPLGITAEGDNDKWHLSLKGAALHQPDLGLLEADLSYSMAEGSFSGNGTLGDSGTFNLTFTGLLDSGDARTDYKLSAENWGLEDILTFVKPEAEGTLRYAEGRLTASLAAKVKRLSLPQQEVTFRDLSFVFPDISVAGKNETTAGDGSVKVAAVQFRNRDIAEITGTIGFLHDRLSGKADVGVLLHPNLDLSCEVQASFEGRGLLQCRLHDTEVTTEKLANSLALPEDLSMAGTVGGEVQFAFSRAGIDGNAKVRLRDGTVLKGEDRIMGIDLDLELPDLPHLRSKPEQLCTIDKIEIGSLRMSDASVRLRLDEPADLFIEKMGLKWCGGRIESSSIRLYKGMKRLATTFYCDRLGYAELLGQLGVGEAEGEGTLNGRLPLDIGWDGVRFDDGYLFSSPGHSGVIKFTDTDMIRQGLEGVEKSTSLEYSIEALEDFTYNWARLRFASEGENLLIALQLDGEPTSPLPYGYKKGQMVKDKDGAGLQHPIQLDVNFRLPADDLFRYGRGIRSLMEKTR